MWSDRIGRLPDALLHSTTTLLVLRLTGFLIDADDFVAISLPKFDEQVVDMESGTFLSRVIFSNTLFLPSICSPCLGDLELIATPGTGSGGFLRFHGDGGGGGDGALVSVIMTSLTGETALLSRIHVFLSFTVRGN